MLVLECVRLHEDHAGSHAEDFETDTYGAAQTAVGMLVSRSCSYAHQSLPLEEPESKVQAIGEVRSIYKGPTIWGEELMEVRWG